MHCNRTAKQHQPPHRQFVFKSIYSFLANINWNQRPHHATVPSSVKIRHPSPSRAQAWNHFFFPLSKLVIATCALWVCASRLLLQHSRQRVLTPGRRPNLLSGGPGLRPAQRQHPACVGSPEPKANPRYSIRICAKKKIMAWYDDMMWLMIHDSDVNFLSSKA